MSANPFPKEQVLFILLGGFFVTNALIAEFIGVKIFALEDSLGMRPLNWNLFGQRGSLNFTAGVLLWPVVFVMTDIINEYFGRRGIRLLSYLAVALIAYAFVMVYAAIRLAPAGWWVESYQDQGVPDMQAAFGSIFGQGMWIIAGSLMAFLIGQLTDVTVFHLLRRSTGPSRLWVRATGSTLVSQLIDSFVVLYIAFVLPGRWGMGQFLAVSLVNYAYKFSMALLLTPLLYLVHAAIDSFLGKEQAEKMMEEAAAASR
jgi:hypothetical protein